MDLIKNILITGCGGDIGQSIAKIIKQEFPLSTVIGTDVHDKHPGKFLCDNFYIVPLVSSPNYLEELRNVIEKHKIEIIIPISEIELRLHAGKQIFDPLKSLGIKLILANQEALEVGFDKYQTALTLKENNLPYPVTHLLSTAPSMPFPFILKSRTGSGSKTLKIVKNIEDYTYYAKQSDALIEQELIGDKDEEYTCGLYKSKDKTKSIVYKRTLQGGYSNYGIKIKNKEIDSLLESLANILRVEGSINVQLRLKNGVPYVFEINPRFSSTVLFRHKMGFKDVVWSILDALNISYEIKDEAKDGSEFYKVYEEYDRLK